jgi:hypothetical protein
MPEEDDTKRSNVIEMPTESRKRVLLGESWICGGWKDLMSQAISSHRMRRHSDLRKICKTVG